MTLEQLAQLSGVSYRVVGEIMSGRASGEKVRFSDVTRDRVKELAVRHNYRPNRAARNLQKKRHNAIALFGRSIYSIHDQTLNKLLSCCRTNNVLPVVEIFSLDSGRQPLSLREDAVDGIIVFEDIPDIREALQRAGLPTVWVNTNSRTGESSITYDELGGVQQAIKHFNGSGRQRTGFINGHSPHYSSQARSEAMRACLGEFPYLGLDASRILASGRKTIIDETCKWLAAHPDLDSVLLYADACAPLLYRAAEIVGRCVPDDIAVIAYNDLVGSQLIQPEVTALAVDYQELAATAFTMLSRLIEGGEAGGPLTMPYRLISRESA